MEQWSQSLLTTVSLCLASNFPIDIIWGPKHVQIYNDGYRVICGASHPRALGESFPVTWASAWPVIGEGFAQALQGKTSFLENQNIFIERDGFREETFFTFSFSPIRDETGEIAGIFHPVLETTTTMLNERRMRVLRDIGATAIKDQTPEEACAAIAETLSKYQADLPFSVLYLLDENANGARLVSAAGLQPGTIATPTFVDFGSEQECPIKKAIQSERVTWINDFGERFGEICCGPYPEPIKKAVVLPIFSPGLSRPIGFFLAGVSARRGLDDVYRGFYELVGNAISAVLNSARAYQEERKRTEALAEIDRAKTKFFSNISHEFRTPLTLMLGPLEDSLKDQEHPLSPEQRARQELTYRNALRLLKLVNSLLDFSRIEAGRMKALFEPTNLSRLTSDLASVFRSAIEKAGLHFNVETESLNEDVFVDRDLWEKIVFNLLSNALKFTFEGEITIKLTKVADHVELSVRDTGTGIPENEIPNLFKRFHKIESARRRSQEGTGIGLALVQELVKMHGGLISVQSKLNVGTLFTVRIPFGSAHLPADQIGQRRKNSPLASSASMFSDEAASWLLEGNLRLAQKSDPSKDDFAHGSRQARIILADDNADMRNYVADLLKTKWRVEAVADGEAAFEAAVREPPALILSDVMMPNLDGFGLIEKLHSNERTKNVPVILLSARAGEEAKIEGLKAGADNYLVKPFSANELLAKLETHIEIGRLRTEAIGQRNKINEIFAQAPVGIAVVEGPEHIFTLANNIYYLIIGGKRDILGKTVREGFSGA